MANGKVCIGFSMPWVALYANNNGTVTYSGGIPLARGVEVDMSVEGADDNNFWADNVLAESDRRAFSSGTITLTVDGLKSAARKLISGVTNTRTSGSSGSSVTWDVYDDDAVIPFVGVGFVVKYMEEGVITYAPFIATKVKFAEPSVTASTETDTIEFQTTSLEGTLYRDDSAKHGWKLVPQTDFSTEEEAVTAYKQILTAAG